MPRVLDVPRVGVVVMPTDGQENAVGASERRDLREEM